MKKIVSLLLALTLALFTTLAMAEEADDKLFLITLTANPTTGYDWVCTVIPEDIVEVETEYLTSADLDKLAGIEAVAEAEPLSGEGGFDTFTVKGLKPGKTVLMLQHMQSWDEESVTASMIYYLTVNEDLSVVCTGVMGGLF